MRLRNALANLAAEPSGQEERLRGMVVRDELALHSRTPLSLSRHGRNSGMLDDSTMADLRVLSDKFSVGPHDSPWSEDLSSPRWAEVRSLEAKLIERM